MILLTPLPFPFPGSPDALISRSYRLAGDPTGAVYMAPSLPASTPDEDVIAAIIDAQNPPTLEDLKAQARQQVAADRYEVETGGIAFGDEMIDTSRTAQAFFTGIRVQILVGEDLEIDWKGSDGEFIVLTNAELLPLANMVFSHVQAAFTREKNLRAQINACETIEELQELDLSF